MCGGFHKRPLVMLAVDLHQQTAELAHQTGADGLIVDEAARSAVRRLNAAQNQIAAFVFYFVLAQERACGVIKRNVEAGGHLALCRTMADKSAIAARTECKRKRVEQDRLAGARFAGQHGETGRKVDLKTFNQDDIADRKMREHQAR